MTTELKITPDFLQYLRIKADDDETIAGQSGRYDDGGAKHLRELICAYEAGRDGKIPAFWVEDLKAQIAAYDPEYVEYQRLKNKYERK